MPAKPRAFCLYPRNKSAQLDLSLFTSPTAEYRGTPFWSWNSNLNIARLLRQIEQFKQMGFGGFHMHSRTGLSVEYVGSQFMEAVVACTRKAAEESMLSWLYDEDRWPSGFAGGLVTRDKQYRQRYLLWTAVPYGQASAGTRNENGTLLARYHVVLKSGRLASYRRLKETEKAPAPGRVWYAYLQQATETSWFNNQTYVDTFSARAIERFIEVTHERYAAAVGEYFRKVVPAIFTDEPQFAKKAAFLRADEARDLTIPFTDDFLHTYFQAYGQRLEDHLPEVFWDLPEGKASVVRWRYHDHTAERFATAFGDVLARWCEAHGIALTGHMLSEESLHGQTRAVGEAMRGLRAFQLPGIDMLCDRMELSTARQAQSVARQYGRPGVLSELYGVTNWDFDFVGHKAQGDWQAALGVTVRVPHLAWESMAGESKRDYPAAIGYQSPWYREYRLVEDHFARLNTVLTRGLPQVRVGVVHPIESSWLSFGPAEHNRMLAQEQEQMFQDITRWLCFGLIDFDYISEALLPSQCPRQKGRRLAVGQMKYDAVVVPALRTIRSTTLDRLESFAKGGGTVIFAGQVPGLVDAAPSKRPARLAARCQTVAFTRTAVLAALEPFREVGVRHEDGSPADSLLHQMRIDGKSRHLFLCNTDRSRPRNNTQIRVRGRWQATLLDTMTGQSRQVPASVGAGWTTIPWSFTAHGHALLTLKPEAGSRKPGTKQQPAEPALPPTACGLLPAPIPVTLSEPNVLLLDQAEWRLDDGPWQEVEEILRLDNKARGQLGLPPRGGHMAQPWTDTAPAPVAALLQLRFAIHSDVDVAAPSLALENAAEVSVQLDGKSVPSTVTGWWVDEDIHTVALPTIAAGEHELTLTIPFTRKTNVEWCYLLGDFGVSVAGRQARLTSPVRQLAWGDWTSQGLPFYAGNVTYHCTVEGSGRETLLEVPRFKAPLLSVDLDGKPAGKIAFAPFELNLGRLDGQHRLDITAYGNRVNAFGAVHNANEALTWYGPQAWRQTGRDWAYEYQLRRMGVLVAPTVKA